jgi:hypothetical protein
MENKRISIVLAMIALVPFGCQAADDDLVFSWSGLSTIITNASQASSNQGSKKMYTYVISNAVPNAEISVGGMSSMGLFQNNMNTTTNITDATFKFPGISTYVIPKEKLMRSLTINVDKTKDGAYRITLTDSATGKKEEFIVLGK